MPVTRPTDVELAAIRLRLRGLAKGLDDIDVKLHRVSLETTEGSIDQLGAELNALYQLVTQFTNRHDFLEKPGTGLPVCGLCGRARVATVHQPRGE